MTGEGRLEGFEFVTFCYLLSAADGVVDGDLECAQVVGEAVGVHSVCASAGLAVQPVDQFVGEGFGLTGLVKVFPDFR